LTGAPANGDQLRVVAASSRPGADRRGPLPAADQSALYRRAAHYVDRILKGTKPGDLSVEQPTQLDW
jgi:hypothetical protein